MPLEGNRAALMMFKGALFDMTDERRAKIVGVRDRLLNVIDEAGDEGKLALYWVTLELAED